jgi:hypothetical protein
MNTPIHVYYDLSIVNNNSNFEKIPVLLKEVRQLPYILNPSLYYINISRFSIQTGSSLPVFIPEIEKGQPDIDKTIYKISLDDGATWKSIQWATQNNTAPIPAPPLTKQDLLSDYYYCNSYQHFIFLLNKTISNEWTLLGYPTPVPFFTLDPATFNLKYHYPVSGNKALNVNQPLFNLLCTFNFYKVANDEYRLDHSDTQERETIVAPFYNPGTFYVSTSENTPLSQWNPISSIVFQTIELPLVQTNVSPTLEFYNRTNLTPSNQQGTQNGNISPILTDFIVSFGANNTYKPYINYTNQGEYRLLDLNGTEPIASLQIQVLWRDNWGNTHNIYLDSGCCASMKLLFRRKDFDNLYL